MSEGGYDIIYVGHDGHDEAIGAIAEAPAASTLVDPVRGLGDFSPEDPTKVALLAQTTLGLYEWEGILSDAAQRFPDLQTARKSDLCYATTNRQTAILGLSEACSVILVVGSENSSNTQALVRVAEKAGVRTYRIDGPDDVDRSWFSENDVVGVTAGASAPDQRVRAVIEAVAPGGSVEILRVTDEDEYFPLPPRLRSFVSTLQAMVEGAFSAPNPGEPGPIENDRGWDASQALDLLGV
jgi:4-hydroxy-3-methylbut-2-enyl diphosphate reductase